MAEAIEVPTLKRRRAWHSCFVAAGWAACLMVSSASLAESQSSQLKRVGVLWSGTPSATAANWGAFVQGMRELGWIECKNAHFVMRFDEDDKTRLPRLAAGFVVLRVDVIAVSTAATTAARTATKTIPIVYLDASDPIAEGLTSTLARPIGNITGVSWQTPRDGHEAAAACARVTTWTQASWDGSRSWRSEFRTGVQCL